MKRVVSTLWILSAWFCLSSSSVHAQYESTGLTCATPEGWPESPGIEIPLTGEFRALIVYVQFRDDTSSSDCARGHLEWPVGDPTPASAPHILSPTPAPPFPDSSLTAFYYEQSNQNFVLYGDTVSYVSQFDEADYYVGRIDLDKQMLGREAFEELYDGGNGRIDFGDYDANGDGYLDHVFFVVRQTQCMIYVQSSGNCVSGVSATYFSESTSTKYGVKVDSGLSGSWNSYGVIDPVRDQVILFAHEFGHDIWPEFRSGTVHLPPITGNRVPYIPPPGEDESYADIMSYQALMIGSPLDHIVGNRSVISMAERNLQTLRLNTPSTTDDWITCIDLMDGTTYQVRDSYTTSDCFRLELDTGARVDEIYISNVQRKQFYGEAHLPNVRVAMGCNDCTPIDWGLETTGLLIERLQRNPTPSFQPNRDILPSDNGLEDWGSCEIKIDQGRRADELFGGDLWRAGIDKQLTPWTRPNIYGYTFESDVLAAGLYASAGRPAIDNIRPTGVDSTKIKFTFRENFHLRPSIPIREDSWMGPVNNTLAFKEVRVMAGATLTIESGADLTFTGNLIADDGSAIVVQPGVTLRFAPGKQLVALGDVEIVGTTLTEATSGQGWGGIYMSVNGEVYMDDVQVLFADVGLETHTSNYARIHDSIFDSNGIGILGDFEYHTGLRSNIDIFDSCVINSQYDDVAGTEGYGIWAKGSNVRIVNSTIAENDSYGLRFEQSDLNIAHGMLVTENGAGLLASEKTGARVLDNGDLTLSTGFYGLSFPYNTERNSIHDNAEDEISIEFSGFATVGIACTGGQCPIENRISEAGFPFDSELLIHNEPLSVIPAQEVFWATLPADPPPSAFLQPTLVDDLLALSSDPASDAGRPGGCPVTQGTRAGAGGGRISASSPGTTENATREFNFDMAEAIGDRIREIRTELSRNPASDSAATLAAELYHWQRLDKEDELGEQTATMALLSALSELLRGTALLDSGLKATAEQAYSATVNDAMRHERYDAAAALVNAPDIRIESDQALLTAELTRIALDEIGANYASAVQRINDLVASLSEGREQFGRDLEARAALLNRRMDMQEIEVDPIEGETYQVHDTAEAETPITYALNAAYPNPFNPQTTLVFSLADASQVELAVYDVLGREISTLVDGRLDRGNYETVFDGSRLASGLYLVRMTVRPEDGTSALAFTQRITLLK